LKRGGSLVAWRVGSVPPVEAGFRIIAAHSDSPNLRLKPNSEYGGHGWRQWGVEIYGAVLLSTWMDRDLGLSGRVLLRDGDGMRQQLIRLDRPLARVPNLAIHLNRKVNTEGAKLNAQKHMPPVVGLADSCESGRLEALLAEAVGCEVDALLSFDLCLHDLQPPCHGGLDNEFLFAPRLDNLGSAWPVVIALANQEETPRATAVAVLYDHEEVGSKTARGAESTWLRNVLERLVRDHEGGSEGGFARAAAHSLLVSVDMAHALHPNYPDKHDAQHAPRLNGGPVIKVNARQRYSSEGETIAHFVQACEKESVVPQYFIHRSDLACGTTIGPVASATLGVRAVDVGNPMLSMHSLREQAGADDVDPMTRVLRRIISA